MSERIRQLEDALCDLQSQYSTESHPLLCEDLLGVKHKYDEPYIPPDESWTLSHPAEVNLSAVETWNYRFATECVAEVAARTLTAEIPSYATNMELDCKVREFPLQPILTKSSQKAHNALAACQNEEPSGQLGQQWSVNEEVYDDELATPAGGTRFVPTGRLSKSNQAHEELRGSGFISYPDSLPEPSVPQLCCPESSTSTVDRWARTEQDQRHYAALHAEHINASVHPQDMPQWQPSHYPYTPQHCPSPPPPVPTSQPQPAPQHTAHGHSTATTPSYSWAQQSSAVSSQFSSAANSAAQSHGYPGYPHAYEQSSAPPYLQPYVPQPSQQLQTHSAQWEALSKLTELELVSQELLLDEHSTLTAPSCSWAQQSSSVSSQFDSATYSAANWSQSHCYPDHPHAYEQSSALPYQQPWSQPSQQPQTQSAQAPSELTALGLVSQESRFKPLL